MAAQETTPASTPYPFAGEPARLAHYCGADIGLIRQMGPVTTRLQPTRQLGEPLAEWSPDGRRLVLSTRGGATEPLYEYDLAMETSCQFFACQAPCLRDD